MATKKTKGGGRPTLKSSHGAWPQDRNAPRTTNAPRASRVARVTRDAPHDLGEAARRMRSAKSARAAARPEGDPSSPHSGPRTRKARTSAAPPHAGTNAAADAAREVAITIAVAALEKKAVGLEILDVAGKVDYADFLVIMTGRSDRQVQALAQAIEEALKKRGTRALAVEGLPHASWVLMDFGDVVVHVFQEDARSLYDIEGLWLDARRIPVPVPEEMR
jgi:ribosome-associated protein